MIDFQFAITFGNVIEILTIACGGVIVFTNMRFQLKIMNDDLKDIQIEIKQMGKILSIQAVHDNRISNLEQDFRLLRQGEGFVMPLFKAKAASKE